MSEHTRSFSEFHQRRLEFRQFVESQGKSVADAITFARAIKFPMPEYYIAHAIFINKWKVGTFSPTENDREERRMNREKIHAKVGNEIAIHYSDCEIEIIEPWE